jgi:hypothetical protein
MTTWRLLLLRTAALSLGAFPVGSRLLRSLLLLVLKSKGRMTYAAHSNFFDVRALAPGGEALPLIRETHPLVPSGQAPYPIRKD